MKYFFKIALLLSIISFSGFAGGGGTEKDTVRINTEIQSKSIIQRMNQDQINALIDLLFDMDSIPEDLVAEINLAIAKINKEKAEKALLNSPYPASNYYTEWTDQMIFPLNDRMPNGDTSLTLCLKNDSCKEFCFPREGVLTSNFGWRDGKNHSGIDIDLEVWDPVKAAFSGRVRVARYQGGYGRVVVIRHYNGLETLYAHLHRFKVKKGEYVRAGDVIGLGGSSGNSTGSHLHFEMRFKGVAINPCHVISVEDKKLIGDTIVLNHTKHGIGVFCQGVKYHTVKKGDTLWDIAQRYGKTTTELARINGISKNKYLRVGQKLRVS